MAKEANIFILAQCFSKYTWPSDYLHRNSKGCFLKLDIPHFPLPQPLAVTILLSASVSLMAKGYKISIKQDK